MADEGGFDYTPSELSPGLCEDLYDNFVGTYLLVSGSNYVHVKFAT